MKRILFLHGLFSNGETSCKAGYMRSLRYDVFAPSLSNWWFSSAAKTAEQAYQEFKPDIIVGSSRGGAVAMAIQPKVPMVLLAPAWKRFGSGEQNINNPCIILHSLDDDLVPFNDSVELYGKNSELYLVQLRGDHSLNSYSAQKVLKASLNYLLNSPTLQSRKLC